MRREFIETSVFQNLAESEKIKELEKRVKDQILKNPDEGDIIQGTGGLRKIRISGDHSGKSGGYRVIYLDFPNKEKTYLLLIYKKNVKENLSQEQKQGLKKLVEAIKNEEKK